MIHFVFCYFSRLFKVSVCGTQINKKYHHVLSALIRASPLFDDVYVTIFVYVHMFTIGHHRTHAPLKSTTPPSAPRSVHQLATWTLIYRTYSNRFILRCQPHQYINMLNHARAHRMPSTIFTTSKHAKAVLSNAT